LHGNPVGPAWQSSKGSQYAFSCIHLFNIYVSTNQVL
jgi:hypothetical protein